jgi:hypothetical protein
MIVLDSETLAGVVDGHLSTCGLLRRPSELPHAPHASRHMNA